MWSHNTLMTLASTFSFLCAED